MELPEILDVVLQYLKVLAWPLVVFTLALVYRKPVITLLQRIKKYSGWGQTVELGEEARDLKRDSEALVEFAASATKKAIQPGAGDTAPNKPNTSEPDHHQAEDALGQRTRKRAEMFQQIASIDPTDFPTGARRAIFKAWRSLGKRTDELARRLDLDANEMTLNGVVVALVNRGLLDKGSALIAFRLSELHHELTLAYDSNLSISVIIDFVKSAENLATILDGVLEVLDAQRAAGAVSNR